VQRPGAHDGRARLRKSPIKNIKTTRVEGRATLLSGHESCPTLLRMSLLKRAQDGLAGLTIALVAVVAMCKTCGGCQG
jgi:hypothetical protein